MESTISFSSTTPFPISFNTSFDKKPFFQLKERESIIKINAIFCKSSVSHLKLNGARQALVGDMHRSRSGDNSSFCYDKPIPEEIIEEPVALSEKSIGDNPRCSVCEAKGAVLCLTCTGSGLYIDSIMESQGITVKVRCLGCGGTGNIMCSKCGGWGHL